MDIDSIVLRFDVDLLEAASLATGVAGGTWIALGEHTVDAFVSRHPG